MSNEPVTTLIGDIRVSGLRLNVFAHDEGAVVLMIQGGDHEGSINFRLSLGDVDAHSLSRLLLDAVKWVDANR